MKRLRLLLVLIAAWSLMACQLLTNLGNAPRGSGGIFSAAADPLNVTLKYDEGAETAQVIPAGGGEVSAVGADGTRYTLAIPAGALLVDTEIRMRPVAAIDGLPFSGELGGAVQLEPSGLFFDDFVTLKIEPTKAIALKDQVLFGFEKDGKDVHLAVPGENSQRIEIRLLHFSGVGVASAVSDEKAAVYRRIADRVEARLTNELANYLQNQRSGEQGDPEALNAIFNEYYNSVVLSRIKAASSGSATCAEAKGALRTYLSWARQASLLGGEEMVAKARNLIAEFGPTAARKCFDEEFERCSAKHEVAGMIPELLSFERQGQLLGALSASDPGQEDKKWAEARAYGRELAVKCFQWNLEFQSSGHFAESGTGFDSRVSATIPIRVQGGAENLFQLNLSGNSELKNDHFEMIDTYELCDVFSTPGGGQFTVARLGWVPELRQDADGELRFYVKDYILRYSPGNTSESFAMECWDRDGKRYPRVNVPPAPWWTGTFFMTHFNETASGAAGQAVGFTMEDMMAGAAPALNSDEAFVATDWQVASAPGLATKSWEGTSTLDAGVTESGEFHLKHTPQR